MDKHIAANPLEPNSTSIHIGDAFITSQEGSDLIPIVFLALSLSSGLFGFGQSINANEKLCIFDSQIEVDFLVN